MLRESKFSFHVGTLIFGLCWFKALLSSRTMSDRNVVPKDKPFKERNPPLYSFHVQKARNYYRAAEKKTISVAGYKFIGLLFGLIQITSLGNKFKAEALHCVLIT